MSSKRIPPGADNFKRIRGIGRAIESRLHEAGILTFDKLASLSPDSIVELIGDLAEVTVERVTEQDWIGQARELTLRREAEKPDEEETAAREKHLVEGEGLTSFVVELLLDEDRQVKRTKVMQVATGHEEAWTGWQESRLLEFFVKHAALGRLSAGSALTTKVKSQAAAEAIAVPAAAAEARVVAAAASSLSPAATAVVMAQPRLRKLEIIPMSTNYPSHILRDGQPFDVRLTLDLSEMRLLKEASLNYTATVYAKSPGGQTQQLVGEASGTITAVEGGTIEVKSEGLPQGIYRLQAVVNLSLSTAKSEPTASFLTCLEGDLLQVY
jgi:predicted flap endonuclease-1-like 5' DNA nuclease